MTKVEPIPNESVNRESEVLREQPLLPTPIDRILQKLSCMTGYKDHPRRIDMTIIHFIVQM